jgi:hypothetical protein
MPLTGKGTKILSSMQSQYGEKRGKSVFYASRNAGTISGVDSACPQHGYMDACVRGDAKGMTTATDTMLRGRVVR